jgi:hypothetical protein
MLKGSHGFERCNLRVAWAVWGLVQQVLRITISVQNRIMNTQTPILDIRQHAEPTYAPRTHVNAACAELTVAFAVDYSSHGERLTKKMAGDRYVAIPLEGEPIDAARILYKNLRGRGARTLNIAGNGIYTLKPTWTQSAVNRWVFEVISLVHQHWPLDSVRSGGQTGVDLAGLVAAHAAGVPRIYALLPNGFIQRGMDKVDRPHTADEIRAQIEQGSAELIAAPH